MKSVVYANLYQTRFQRVSLPLAEETLVPFRLNGLTPYRSLRDLLLWFRGHDIGHSFRLPETDYERLQSVGLENMWMLQEAIADVMGYLMVVNGPWWHLLYFTASGTAHDAESGRRGHSHDRFHQWHYGSSLLRRL